MNLECFRNNKILSYYQESNSILIHKKPRNYKPNKCSLCNSYKRNAKKKNCFDNQYFVSVRSKYSILKRSMVLIFKLHVPHMFYENKMENELVKIKEFFSTDILYINSYSSMSVPSHFHLGAVSINRQIINFEKKLEDNNILNFDPVYFIKVPSPKINALRRKFAEDLQHDTNFLFFKNNWFVNIYDKTKVISDYGVQESLGVFSTSKIERYNKLKEIGLINYQKLVNLKIDESVKLLKCLI